MNVLEFSESIGITKTTYYNWKEREFIPNDKAELAEKLYPYGSELISMIKDPKTEYNKRVNHIHPDPNGKEIPYYETEVFATISPAMGDVVALKPDTFIRIPMFSQGQFALTVTGNSMKGFINHGDWVVIRAASLFLLSIKF